MEYYKKDKEVNLLKLKLGIDQKISRILDYLNTVLKFLFIETKYTNIE